MNELSFESKNDDVIAIVPAAGIGSRMKTIHPKQYLKIGKYSILEHSISCLFSHSSVKQVIIALKLDDQYFSKLSLSKDPRILSVSGGKTRAESVLSALKVACKKSWILVHDAVRPCLHVEDLSKLLKVRKKTNIGAILATPIQNTIKKSDFKKNIITSTINRKYLWNALTPQYFPHDLLIDCLMFSLKSGIDITDESSAIEHCGYHPIIVKGRSDNIKITNIEDLTLALFYINKLNKG